MVYSYDRQAAKERYEILLPGNKKSKGFNSLGAAAQEALKMLVKKGRGTFQIQWSRSGGSSIEIYEVSLKRKV